MKTYKHVKVSYFKDNSSLNGVTTTAITTTQSDRQTSPEKIEGNDELNGLFCNLYYYLKHLNL